MAERAEVEALAARMRADLEALYLPCDADAAQAA
jgi:hypothetical protein